MAEKKAQEISIPEEQINSQADKEKPVKMQSQEKATNTEKPPPVMVPVSLPTVPVATTVPGRVAVMPIFSKTPPNDLYRRLLPAVLFLLTFVTVMTMLLVYMDTVALGAQQFRLNMSRDYELASIAQDSPSLIQYVRQVHLAPRPAPADEEPLVETESVRTLDKLFGPDYIGTFVEILPSGGASASALALQRRGWRGVLARAAPRDYLALRAVALHACLSPIDHPRERRGWRGVVARAAPRDYLALRAVALHACLSPIDHPRERRGWRGVVARAAPRDYLALRAVALHACLSPIDHPREVKTALVREVALALQRRGWRGVLARAAPRDYLALPAVALHACLSPIDHPREVAYHEPSSPGGSFWSRVLCLPLYTVLAAADALRADYLALGGAAAPPALRALPPTGTRVKVIEYLSTDPALRNQTAAALLARNYTLLAERPDGIMYVLQEGGD
ncbi:unnamed protein product [Plutella xylostella]|uniref:(diamondback moth) hypothetical protein n=1 Tax=Plutella xylostella TaxID=51655 RepID=A0A8S4G756_PLUXY|nr:unnamed protein product [Plutella xylostella]